MKNLWEKFTLYRKRKRPSPGHSHCRLRAAFHCVPISAHLLLCKYKVFPQFKLIYNQERNNMLKPLYLYFKDAKIFH